MIRFEIRVKPRARSNRVGGSWGEQGALLVEVQAPAVDGKANKAVETVLAKAFSLRRSQVTIVAGHKSRSKVIELDPGTQDKAETQDKAGSQDKAGTTTGLGRRLADLLSTSGDDDRPRTD